jgi:hypothetical protein
MQNNKHRAVTFDGDIIRIDGKPTRMTYMVRDAFWAHGRAIVLLDPNAFLDVPTYHAQRRRARKPVHNLCAYSAAGELLWQAEQPEASDHYYLIESQDPLVALSFSAFRCMLDPANGKILRKQNIK